MRIESARALIEEVTKTQEIAPGIRVYLDDGRTLPMPVGLGRRGAEHRLVIFGSDPVVAEALVAKAAGEADVYLIGRIERRITSTWAKQPHEIIGIGRQIGPVGFGWVGTGGILVRAASDPSVILQITNEHVVGERAPRGRVMHQGGRSYSVVWETGGVQFSASQKWDVGSCSVDRNRRINPLFEHGLDRNLAGLRRMTPDDINRRFTNTGQTRGTLFGSCIAVEVRDLSVGYDGGVAQFHDQCAFIGENGLPFSVGGHSGSTIVCVDDDHATALLFAGGPDEQGRDVTFAASDFPGAIAAAGGTPSLIV